MTRALVLLLIASITACATPAAVPHRWRGVYEFQFETSSFRPERSRENWWVSAANEESAAQLRAALHPAPNGPPWGRAVITVEGELSEAGHYGHMGAYDHQLSVTRVISAEPAPRT